MLSVLGVGWLCRVAVSDWQRRCDPRPQRRADRSGAAVGDPALPGDGPVGRQQGDGQPGDRADQVQAVVGAVEGQEVDVAVAGREQPVQERQAVAGGQQPAVGPGGVQPAPEGQPGQADGQVDQVVQGN
jgi:hypothetical protein